VIRHSVVPLTLLICCASLTIAQAVPPRVRVSERAMQERLIHRADPARPFEAGAHLTGTVVLKAIVNKSGDIEKLELISGHPLLVAAAIDAVKQWKYAPYEINGNPVIVETLITVEFPPAGKNPNDGSTEQDPAPSTVEPDSATDSAAKSAQPETPAPLEVPPDIVQALLLKRVAPVYPPLARQARIQATVVLNIVINKSGEVRDIQLYSGHPILAPAAIEAVKQWRYRPYEQNGQPVEIKTTVQINFTLPGA
jgi:TonB family protein